MSLLFSLIVVLCFSPAVTVPCRQDWLQFEESCYGFGEITVSWEDAAEICRSSSARLAEIETSEENEFLKSEARVKGGQFWVGATDVYHEGTWTWMSTGALLDAFSDWHPGEPNDVGDGQDCLHLKVSYDYQWDDGNCQLNMKFICETELEETVVG